MMPDHMELEELVNARLDTDVNRCVCCGEIIPEGRMVCMNCEEKEELQNENELEGSV